MFGAIALACFRDRDAEAEPKVRNDICGELITVPSDSFTDDATTEELNHGPWLCWFPL